MGYYDEIAASYNELHRDEQLSKLSLIYRKLKEHGIKITQETTLLDVGCGTGISTDFWSCKATGIDPAKGLLHLNTNQGRKSTLLLGSAEDIQFDDDSFDIVISITAIQNFHDIGKGLDEIRRVGKGFYVLSFLKKSQKSGKIRCMIESRFNVSEIIEEDKDFIFFCRK